MPDEPLDECPVCGGVLNEDYVYFPNYEACTQCWGDDK
jgi:hypothetical protein